MSTNPEQTEFTDSSVDLVFKAYPQPLKTRLLALRELIFKTAAGLQAVGDIEETLKWGQPSYLTQHPKTGTTIRIDAVSPDRYALYVHCQTNLIETFKQMYADKFEFSGNRAIIFDQDKSLPEKQLSHCIALALTYHLNK